MRKQIRLQAGESFVYAGRVRYLVPRDSAAGKPDRYTVFLLTDQDPITIGRELPLADVRRVILNAENTILNHERKLGEADAWLGDRDNLLELLGLWGG